MLISIFVYSLIVCFNKIICILQKLDVSLKEFYDTQKIHIITGGVYYEDDSIDSCV